MTTNQIIALVALIVGLAGAGSYVALALGREPRLLSKLRPMQQRFGFRLGTAIHFTAYVLLPLAVAVLLYLNP